jgi:hypothetical protein
MTYRPGIDCPHCGGSGMLVKTDPEKPWIINWRAGTKTPNAISNPFPCTFCGGTGRDSLRAALNPGAEG